MIRDARDFPELFDLDRPATGDEVARLESDLGVELPPSYLDVLEQLGQGSFFDNETLLGVHPVDDAIGEIAAINQELHDKQGLAPSLIVFHLGLGGLHAFDTSSNGPEYEVVALDEDTLERGPVYDNFAVWYVELLRAEYASILGLE